MPHLSFCHFFSNAVASAIGEQFVVHIPCAKVAIASLLGPFLAGGSGTGNSSDSNDGQDYWTICGY